MWPPSRHRRHVECGDLIRRQFFVVEFTVHKHWTVVTSDQSYAAVLTEDFFTSNLQNVISNKNKSEAWLVLSMK